MGRTVSYQEPDDTSSPSYGSLPSSQQSQRSRDNKTFLVGLLCPFMNSFESEEDRRRRWLQEDEDELARAEAVPIEVVDVVKEEESIAAVIVSPDLSLSLADFSTRPVVSVLKTIKLILVVAFLGGCASLFL